MRHPRLSPVRLASLLGLSLMLGGCTDGAADADADAATGAPPPGAAAPPPAPAPDTGFDLAAYPVSTVTLGPFPHIALPDGYRADEAQTVELDSAPMWTGEEFQWIEGRVHQSAIFAGPDHAFSQLEIDGYIRNALERIGAAQVARFERIPVHEAAAHGLTDALRTKYRAGLGHFYAAPGETWLARRADGDLWVFFTTSDRSAHWIIARSARYDPTIRLLSGVELKRLIEADGKAIIHVNFASGDGVVSESSIPQIEQVALLLRNEPALRLSIEGHTDDTGSAGRNEALSLARAEAVRDALRSHAVDAARLEVAGHGASRPVAGNDDADGRARNRRVELVRL